MHELYMSVCYSWECNVELPPSVGLFRMYSVYCVGIIYT